MARCWCRKPRPGLAIEALNDLARQYPGEFYPPYMALMVGDRPEDEAMAQALDVGFVWAAEWRAGA
jgi:phosphoglycolate phosphatase-like HAD superfamily hydrolase